MENLWKFLMQANAKALFVIALFVLLGISAWRGWVEFAAERRPAPEEQVMGRAEFKPGKDLGLLDFAAKQLATVPDIPVNPFRPTLESLAANPAALAALTSIGWRRTTGTPTNAVDPNPFAHVRVIRTSADNTGATGATGAAGAIRAASAPQVVIPRLTYKGFFKRPDGQTAALFHDSAANTSAFKLPGDALRDATLVSADIRHARLLLASGEEVTLAINEAVELPPETP